MTWQNIIRKRLVGYEDYKMYFSFFDGETLPFGSVIEYTGSRANNSLPVIPDWESGKRQARLEKETDIQLLEPLAQHIVWRAGITH